MKYSEEQMFNRLNVLGFDCWVKAIEQYSLGFEVVTTFNTNTANEEILDDIDFINEVDSAMCEWDI